jgi:hypothetical protein
MTFDEALKFMRCGKKLTRKKWNGAYIFIGKDVESLEESIYCGTRHTDRIYKVRNFDASGITSDDWSIVEEDNKEE